MDTFLETIFYLPLWEVSFITQKVATITTAISFGLVLFLLLAMVYHYLLVEDGFASFFAIVAVEYVAMVTILMATVLRFPFLFLLVVSTVFTFVLAFITLMCPVFLLPAGRKYVIRQLRLTAISCLD